MELPAIIVNFKIYEQATGEAAITLAKVHEKVAKESGKSIGIAVSALDLAKVVESVDIPVFAQHVDPVSFGSGTGKISPQMVKDLGAYGTLLNHAEFQIGDDVLKESLKMAKDAGLYTVVCANTPEAAKKIAGFGPNLVAVEPPELIGGDVSVSKAEPAIIEKTVELCGDNVLVGAGVKSGEDVKIALALGAKGVLLASGVTKAEDPYAVLMDLVAGLS